MSALGFEVLTVKDVDGGLVDCKEMCTGTPIPIFQRKYCLHIQGGSPHNVNTQKTNMNSFDHLPLW
jgi:hypothetical protein